MEKASFLKLDNITLGYNIKTPSTSALKNFRIYATVQNAFVITKYAGIDPEPVLTDLPSLDNGGFRDATVVPDVLSQDRTEGIIILRPEHLLLE